MKQKLLLLLVAVVLVVGIFFTIRNNQNKQEKRESEAMKVEQEEQNRLDAIKYSYKQFHNAVGSLDGYYDDYLPPEAMENESRTYLFLKFYERQTGIAITLDDIKEYMSQQYEEDGSLRLYDNRKHPKLEAYVDFIKENDRLYSSYYSDVADIIIDYNKEHPGNQLVYFPSKLPLDIIVEIVKKEADPDYEMQIPEMG